MMKVRNGFGAVAFDDMGEERMDQSVWSPSGFPRFRRLPSSDRRRYRGGAFQ